MFITVTGGKPNQRKYVESMVEFCINTLMPRMKTLDITVRLCTPKGAMGYCLELDNKREFDIEIDRTQPMRKMLETLAHEMVHVKQFARGELDPNMTRWKSNRYVGDIEYWDQPWEKEARKLQHKMAELFTKGLL